MLFGVLLTLDRLGIVTAIRSVQLWPAILVVLGASVAMRRRDSRGRFWGVVLILIGSWSLLNNLGVIGIGVRELVWPLALVLLGVSLMMQTLRRGSQPPRSASGESAQSSDGMHAGPTPVKDARRTVTLFAVLGESKRTCDDSPFRGGEMTAFMGGCHLDLRQATIPPGDEAIVDVFAMMGGHEIWVPGGWTVVSQVVPLLGSVDDKRLPAVDRATTAAGDARPRLLLRGFVMMGSLVIRS